MVAVNMETYKYNSTFSLSEYWRIFTSYTNLGFASVCILVNIRQYRISPIISRGFLQKNAIAKREVRLTFEMRLTFEVFVKIVDRES